MGYSQLKEIISEGLKAGFRAFDTARDYGNEPIVGRVIQECLKEQGLKDVRGQVSDIRLTLLKDLE